MFRSNLFLATFTAFIAVQAGQAAAVLVAYYTFDDADTTITGDGSSGNPFQIDVADASGNGNTARNMSTQLSQLPAPNANVYGAANIPGEPGKFGQSHKFFRDPSVFQTSGGGGTAKDQQNTTYLIDPGVVPTGSNQRTFSLWFNQEVDVTAGGSQDKLFGYGSDFPGEAFDIGLENGGIRLRHFDGSITWGSGLDFDGADAGWRHLAVRVNAGASTFAGVDVFLDGVQLSVSATEFGGVSTTLDTNDNVDGFGLGNTSISAFNSAQNGFQGWLDEFRIYDTALTNLEIMSLANPGLAGDFNNDGKVNAADYTVWRDHLGAGDESSLNGNGDGMNGVDQGDYSLWRSSYGATTALPVLSLAIPEPLTVGLAVTAAGLLSLTRRRAMRFS